MDSDLLKWIWRTLIFARGAVAAIALVAILDTLFGWDRANFLEIVHAVVVHWNYLLQILISPLLNWIPILPKPTSEGLNLVALWSTTLPFMVGVPIVRFQRGEWRRGVFFSLLIPVVLLICWTYHLPTERNLTFSYWGVLGSQVAMLIAMVALSLYDATRSFDQQYARAIVFFVLFIGMLEVLYYVPTLAKYGDRFVRAAETIEAKQSVSP